VQYLRRWPRFGAATDPTRPWTEKKTKAAGLKRGVFRPAAPSHEQRRAVPVVLTGNHHRFACGRSGLLAVIPAPFGTRANRPTRLVEDKDRSKNHSTKRLALQPAVGHQAPGAGALCLGRRACIPTPRTITGASACHLGPPARSLCAEDQSATSLTGSGPPVMWHEVGTCFPGAHTGRFQARNAFPAPDREQASHPKPPSRIVRFLPYRPPRISARVKLHRCFPAFGWHKLPPLYEQRAQALSVPPH
jgi:hypothetical protein